MAGSIPTGVVTLMFTDIQDSTSLWERMGDRFRPVLEQHNQIISERVLRWGGCEVKSHGDSFMVAFERGTDAVQCAVETQRALAEQPWPPEVGELRIRIGMHTGEPFLGYDSAGRADYFGPVVNRAARITDAGHGGQILVSTATCDTMQGALTDDLQLLDLGRHRLRGMEEPEHLFEVRHPALASRRFPPLRTLDTFYTNLPIHLTTFVGRKKELADLRALLSKPETRLLTITGPGGTGKTRLAHEVASECAGHFDDGVWLASLDDVNEPANVVPQIATAVQLIPQPNRDPREQLIAFLKPRVLLLVLDSFERAMGASVLIAEILKSAPRVKCLITSQIVLRLGGEQAFSVPAMQAPPERAVVPEELFPFDSAALFVERARAVRSEFVLTADNAPVVAEICRKLDGVPLALELAAAQIAEMSVMEVLEGVGSQLDTLRSERPDVPERQRTLRAAIDWSYGLLDPTGQRALQQLSAFSGGCFRESALAVFGADGWAGLRTLHRHSFLSTSEGLEGRTRYRFLPMVREYARARLEEQPEAAREVKDRHVRYYLGYAEERTAQRRTRGEARALDELGEELDNLRAAMDWALESQQDEPGARLALALYEPLYGRGFWEEAVRRLEVGWAAAERLSSREAASGQARTLLAALQHHRASLAEDQGALTQARELAKGSLALWRDLNDTKGLAEALNLLGLIAKDEGDHAAAHACFEEALGLLSSDDHARRGMVLNNLALLASRRGDSDEARRLYQEGLAHQRSAGDLRHEATTLGNLGALAQYAGEIVEARRFYRESLTLRRELRDRYGIAVMLNNLGELAEHDGDLEVATALFVHAERILRDLQAADVTFPTESLKRLAEQWGAERWAELRAAAERAPWEELVGEGKIEGGVRPCRNPLLGT